MVRYIKESKKVTEAVDQIDTDIKITKKMQNLPDDILEDMYDYGTIEYYQNNDDVPMPWDADMWIEDGKIVFAGGLGPGNAGKGYCKCYVPLENANEFYTIHVRAKDPKIIAALYKYGWLEKE